MSTFKQQKNFFRRYGYLLGYVNDDLLHWYFSYTEAPTDVEIRIEIEKRLQAKDTTTWFGPQRKNYRRNSRKVLYAQISSVDERADIQYKDSLYGVSPLDSLAVASFQLTLIRQLRTRDPGQPASTIWVPVGQVFPAR